MSKREFTLKENLLYGSAAFILVNGFIGLVLIGALLIEKLLFGCTI